MEFQSFLSKLSQIKSILERTNYNGIDLQLKMIPKERLNFNLSSIKNPKKAAVLALIYQKNNQAYLLLTLRASYKGIHAAQISLPGGKYEFIDKNLTQTALRETEEEVGVDAKLIQQTIPLSKVYIPPSNYWVSPFIGVLHSTPRFKKNYEVAEIIEISIDDLLNNDNLSIKKMTTNYANNIEVPCFKFNKNIVWGATAVILSELKEIINLTID